MMRIYEQYEVVNFKPAEVAVFIRNGWQLSPGMTGKLCPFFPLELKFTEAMAVISQKETSISKALLSTDLKIQLYEALN